MTYMYGLRGIGKTTLLKEVMTKLKEPTVYVHSRSVSDKIFYRDVCDAIAHVLPLPKEDIVDPFSYLFTLSQTMPITLILDNYQAIYDFHKIIHTKLLDHYHHHQKTSHLHLVLCGRGFLDMRDIDTHYHALMPLSYKEASKFYPTYSNEEKLQLYSIFGGIPGYIKQIDISLGVLDNLKALQKNGTLHDMVYLSIYQHPSTNKHTESVLSAIAQGNHTFTTILDATGIQSHGSMYALLQQLQQNGIILKEYPLDKENDKSKATYHIVDPLVHFYLRYLTPTNQQPLQIQILQNELFPRAFKAICMQYLQEKYPTLQVGKYYETSHKDYEIITKDDSGYRLYLTAYTNSLVSQSMLEVKARPAFDIGFFSKSGFDKDIKVRKHFYTLDDVYAD